MLEYRAEGLCRNANHLSREELSRCMASGEVLQSTALAYDTGHRLRFELGGLRGIMPFADCVDAAPGETVKDIAVLTRVGRRPALSSWAPSLTITARNTTCSPAPRHSAAAGHSILTHWRPAASSPAP